MVARVLWEYLARVRISAPRKLIFSTGGGSPEGKQNSLRGKDLVPVQIWVPRIRGCRITAIITPFQGVDEGSTPFTRSTKNSHLAVFEIRIHSHYFAYSITLISLITLTFISPGYFNSS